jgi:hypothetical protein
LSAANEGSQPEKEIELKLTRKVVLAAIFALTMFVPSFQPVTKADPTTTVVTLTTNAIDIFLMIDGTEDGYKPRLPPPPPPPPKK